MSPLIKKPWHTPRLRTEEVQETLARPACSASSLRGRAAPGRPSGPPPHGPAFS